MYTDYWCDYITLNQVMGIPVSGGLQTTPQTQKTTKVDIFETLNLLIFPYDPIRDWTKKKVTEINERFKPLEKALGI